MNGMWIGFGVRLRNRGQSCMALGIDFRLIQVDHPGLLHSANDPNWNPL